MKFEKTICFALIENVNLLKQTTYGIACTTMDRQKLAKTGFFSYYRVCGSYQSERFYRTY